MGRAQGQQHGIAGVSRRGASRTPELRIQFDDAGRSTGLYEVTRAIKLAIDKLRTAYAGGVRVFTPYAREQDPVEYAEQMCAILRMPVERFAASADGRDCVISGATGSATVNLPAGSAQRIADALRAGDALFFEGDDDISFAHLQSLLAASLNGEGASRVTVADTQARIEVLPSPEALAFFPIAHTKEDTRLYGSALVGARAIALDDRASATYFSSPAADVRGGIHGDTAEDTAFYRSLDLDVPAAATAVSTQRASAAMHGRIATLASSGAAGGELGPLSDAAVGTALGAATERLRAASRMQDSGIVSAPSPEEIGVAAAETGMSAALGDEIALGNFIQGLDHLVSVDLTGDARDRALVSALGEDVVEQLNDTFKNVWWANGGEVQVDIG